jgi:3-deoxy-D-manno-octulosonic-acid transferase
VAPFNKKAGLFADGQKSVFGYLEDKMDSQNANVWFHAASLGEFEQGRPLIEKLKETRPDVRIIVTFFSPSGYEVRKNYTGADAICYLPLDTPANVSRFLKLVNPQVAVFIKYEFWANYLKTLHANGTKVYLISGIFRPDQLFFKRHGKWYRQLLKNFDRLFVQDGDSAALLNSIGIQNVTIAGDTRFDRVIEIAEQKKELPLIEAFATGAQVWVAGSTWPADEDLLISYFNNRTDFKLIIAPHVTSESHVEAICSKLRRKYVRYSSATPEEAREADCLIIDTIGLLSSIYRFGEVAYIGGGFGVGIHNVLEAAVYAMPVLFGPNYGKFKEAVDLINLNGAFSFDSKQTFEKMADKLMESRDYVESSGKIAGEYVQNHRGATSLIIEECF